MIKKRNILKNRNTNIDAFRSINLTPIIDLMLVLMVIFLFSATGIVSGIKLNLPKTKTATTDQSTEDYYINISIDKNYNIYINDKNSLNLTLDLKDYVLMNNFSKDNIIIILNIDSDIKYGNIISVIDLLRNNGYYKILFSTINTKDEISN